MSVRNTIQFAVVREDPFLEIEGIQRARASTAEKKVLLIASGGCTALSTQAVFPNMDFTLVDPNPAQLELIQKKMNALENRESFRETFSIGKENALSLVDCGNFESLFRSLRRFLNEFVMTPEGFHEIFSGDIAKRRILIDSLFENSYWPVAFDIFFADSFLQAMFGPAAIQHAPQGSYAHHFRTLFERGLHRPDASENYFLHHVFLGHYLTRALPLYLTLPTPKYRFEFLRAFAEEVPSYSGYGVVSLSNIFDWMPEDGIHRVAQRLAREMNPGSVLIFRQLNHAKSFEKMFGAAFTFDQNGAEDRFQKDRSLFYSKLCVAVKN